MAFGCYVMYASAVKATRCRTILKMARNCDMQVNPTRGSGPGCLWRVHALGRCRRMRTMVRER